MCTNCLDTPTEIFDVRMLIFFQVWYAPPYAARWNFELLKSEEDEIGNQLMIFFHLFEFNDFELKILSLALDLEKKYKCFECSASFDTPAKFEAHLSQHEAG